MPGAVKDFTRGGGKYVTCLDLKTVDVSVSDPLCLAPNDQS